MESRPKENSSRVSSSRRVRFVSPYRWVARPQTPLVLNRASGGEGAAPLLGRRPLHTGKQNLHPFQDLAMHLRVVETCPKRHESTSINHDFSRIMKHFVAKTGFVSSFPSCPAKQPRCRSYRPSLHLGASGEPSYYIVSDCSRCCQHQGWFQLFPRLLWQPGM